MNVYTNEELKDNVFDLNDEDKVILEYIALLGPMNFFQLNKHTKKHTRIRLHRTALENHISGTAKNPEGLIKREYLMKVSAGKTKWNKPTHTMHLTLKGLIAISTSLSLNSIYLYKKYQETISKLIDDKNIQYVIFEYIKNSINIILIWHALKGIQLKNLTASVEYFLDFLDQPFLDDVDVFRIPFPAEYFTKEMRDVFLNYFGSKWILHYFLQEGTIPSMLSYAKWPKGRRILKVAHIPDADKHKAEIRKLILNWPIYIQNLQKVNYDLDKVFYNEQVEESESRPEILSENEFKKNVEEQLAKIRRKIKWPTIDDFTLNYPVEKKSSKTKRKT